MIKTVSTPHQTVTPLIQRKDLLRDAPNDEVIFFFMASVPVFSCSRVNEILNNPRIAGRVLIGMF